MKQYYVIVELRDYDNRLIAESSCTCESDISDQSVIAAARVAGELMVRHHTGIPHERLEQLSLRKE